jgi:hypothetical protein
MKDDRYLAFESRQSNHKVTLTFECDVDAQTLDDVLREFFRKHNYFVTNFRAKSTMTVSNHWADYSETEVY